MTAPHVFLVAAEPSGDLLGREVAEELRALNPTAKLSGIGGSEMAKVGLSSEIDTSPLSVLGFLEGLMAYRDVVRLADQAADIIIRSRPDCVVLIDSWGFMLRLAQRIRTRAPDIHIIKLIGPQIWATRPGRAKTLAQTVDHVLCIHEIEPAYYEPFGLKASVIGNPAIGRMRAGNEESFRSEHGIKSDEQILLVLPGSRQSEIKRVAPVLIDAAAITVRHRPNLKLFYAPSPAVRQGFERLIHETSAPGQVIWDDNERLDLMAAADLALACSGTVTTELAVQKTPMIIGYKTGWITWALARGLLYQKKHIALLNIMSDDQEVVPEFVQTRFSPSNISQKALELLSTPELLSALRQNQNKALSTMRADGDKAAKRAALAILEDI